jgi:hypothetical protein
MSTVARRFAASPERLPSVVWSKITSLICSTDLNATAEFQKVTGIGSSVITDHSMEEHPLVVVNDGPRLRIYCLYGDKATSEDDRNENPLTWSPTEGDWHAYLPCGPEDYDDFKTMVKSQSSKFSVYNTEEGLQEGQNEENHEKAGATATIKIDWEAFKKK